MAVEINKQEMYSMRYPSGTIIELTAPIEDKYTPKPVGARFKVDLVDSALQLHGHWLPPQSGSMAVNIEVDSFIVVS